MRLTREQALEYKKCSESVIYTIEKHGHLKHITRGKIKWEPYDWQIELFQMLENDDNIVILKSRQVGASWTIAGYVAWLVHFRPDIEVLLLSQNLEKAIKLLGKVYFVCANFPTFVQREFGTRSKTRLSVIHKRIDGKVQSQSSIDSLTTTGSSGRGDTAAFVFTDELAHMQNADEVWAAVKPATSRGGQLVAASSPSGPEGVFARLWMDADTGESATFKPLRVHYTDCGFDEDWLEDASDGMTEEDILQEYELAFVGTGSPAFSIVHLEQCYIPMKKMMADPACEDLRRMIINSDEYFSGVDTAEIKVGRGRRRRDYNAITSLNKFGIQIAAEANQMTLDEWAGKTVDVADKKIEIRGYVSKWHEKYPGLMFIEENGPGLTVENRHTLPDDVRCDISVKRTSAKRKSRIVDQFKLALAGQQVLITDKATYYQLTLYQDLGGGKYSAPKGTKDDLVIAIVEAYDALVVHGGYDFIIPAVENKDAFEVFADAGGIMPNAPAIPQPGLADAFDFTINSPQITAYEWDEFLPNNDRIDKIMDSMV